ncbi:MAG TPA: hypothetical protein VFE53_15705 [Mucilaginibacter sp.]|jgi:hypothetical protein|nr:hypothetical protein [Mucilaginibacter sp.]
MMKRNDLPVVFLVFVILAGCKKGNEGTPPSIVAKWDLVNDSAVYHNTPEGFTTNYKGQPGDYFDFRDDGKCYTKECKVYDTLSYHLITDTTAVIQGFGINIDNPNYYSLIKPLTYHNATITSPDLLVPGVAGTGSHRIVNLRR